MLFYMSEDPSLTLRYKSTQAISLSGLNRAQGCFLSGGGGEGGTCLTGHTESSLDAIALGDTGNRTVWFWPGVSCLLLGTVHERGRRFSRHGQHRENSENKTDKHRQLQLKKKNKDFTKKIHSAAIGWLRKTGSIGPRRSARSAIIVVFFKSTKDEKRLSQCLRGFACVIVWVSWQIGSVENKLKTSLVFLDLQNYHVTLLITY